MSRISDVEQSDLRIEIRTFRHKAGWTYLMDVDYAGALETDTIYLTRQSATEAATLRLIRELPALFELAVSDQVPNQVGGR